MHRSFPKKILNLSMFTFRRVYGKMAQNTNIQGEETECQENLKHPETAQDRSDAAGAKEDFPFL